MDRSRDTKTKRTGSRDWCSKTHLKFPFILPRMANGPGCRLVFSSSALAGSASDMKPEVPPLPERKTEGRGNQCKEWGRGVRLAGRRCSTRQGSWRFTEGLRASSSWPSHRRRPSLITPPLRPPSIENPEGNAGEADALAGGEGRGGLRGTRPLPWAWTRPEGCGRFWGPRTSRTETFLLSRARAHLQLQRRLSRDSKLGSLQSQSTGTPEPSSEAKELSGAVKAGCLKRSCVDCS